MDRLKAHEKHVGVVASVKPIPFSKDVYDTMISKMCHGMKSFESQSKLDDYLERRWSEFCVDAIATLTTKLQPRGQKWGYKLELGRMNCGYLDKMLCANTHCLKEVIDTSIILNRTIVPAKLYKYQFLIETGFPKMDTDEEWWNNLHLPTPTDPSYQSSQFTRLTFVSNDYDNRVYCHYQLKNWNMIMNTCSELNWEEHVNEDGDVIKEAIMAGGVWNLTT